MKKLYTLFLVFLSALSLNAQLNPGDIAILQMNCDGSGTTIKFISFVDIPNGDVIYFTDNAYNGSSLNSNEGTVTWTSTGITCGTIVSFGEGGMALSTSGDQIIAYQITSGVTSYVTAIHSDGSGFLTSGSTSSNSSYVPSGLTEGTNAVAISETDNMVYDASVLSGTIASIKAAIFDNANWTSSNSTTYDFTSTFTLTDCPSSSTPSISSSTTSIIDLDYVFGAGPSGIDSATVSGANLTGAVSGTAITNFEFSLDKSTWGAFPGAISGPVINVTPVKVYVRLIAGLAVGTYSETITLSSVGASDLDVTFSGEVTAAPCVSSLQTLPYNGISGATNLNHDNANPPVAGPVEVCGSNYFIGYTSTPGTDASDNEFGTQSNVGLSGLSSADFGGEASFETFPIDVSGVTAVTVETFGTTTGSLVFNGTGEQFEWWYSLDGATPVVFFSTTADGSLADTESPINVIGVNQIVVGFTFNVNGGGDGFEDMDVTVEEYNANLPTILIDTTSMEGFTYVEGAGPSATQTNILEWANLTASVSSGNVVTNFEFSGDAGATWNDATALNVAIPPFPGSSTAPISVLVRLKAGLVTGTYFDTVVLTSTGADTVRVYLEGEVTPAPLADCSQLFISEYGEPDGGSNKYIEIYNPTATAVDLSDYEIWKISNGGSWAESTVPLSGTLNSGEVYVISGTSFNSNVDLVNTSSINFNGNDAMGLAYDDGTGFVLIDAVGEDGGDPGSGWNVAGTNNATADNILVRKATVKAPNTDWTSAAGTNTTNSEWEVISYTGGMALTTLGNHTSSCISAVNTWTGNTGTDWHTASNWSKNAVPVATDSVDIPTSPIGGNFPLASADVEVRALTVQSGATLDIAPSFGLSLVESGENSGVITLNSDASGTAWFDDFTNSASFTGNLTVETFVTTGSGLGQRYFGSAVTSGSVQGLDNTYTGYGLGQLIPTATCDPTSLDASSPYSNLFRWNEDATFASSCVQEGWEAIGAGATLTPGRAYSGWMNDGSVIRVTGTPNSGDVSFATSGVTVASGNAGHVVNAHGWHLLANPFPSPLNVSSVINSGFTSPQIYNGGSGPYSGTFNPVLINGDYLAVMQGFVAESNNTGGETFTASQADRHAGNEIWQRPDFTHMLEISVTGNNKADRTYIYYDFDATNQFDNLADCKKRESDFGHPTLFSDLNGERMSLNGFALDAMDRTVGLGLLPGDNGSFTLNFDGITSFPASTLIFLEDKLTGTFVNVRENNSYTFQATTNDVADRFDIHFTAPITVETTAATCIGDDAAITMDLGTYSVNNMPIEWDYTLTASTLVVENAQAVSGQVAVENLAIGMYDLSFTIGAYQFTMPIELDGVQKVVADFQHVPQVEEGATITLSNLSSGAIDYTWTVEGQTVNTIDLSHTFNNVGLVDVRLVASNDDCQETLTQTVEVYGKATAIKNSALLETAKVYSSAGLIVVDLSKMNFTDKTKVEVYNLLGQLVQEKEMANTVLKLNVSDAKAYYLVKLTNGMNQKVFKTLLK